jgi:hypothetical protein
MREVFDRCAEQRTEEAADLGRGQRDRSAVSGVAVRVGAVRRVVLAAIPASPS